MSVRDVGKLSFSFTLEADVSSPAVLPQDKKVARNIDVRSNASRTLPAPPVSNPDAVRVAMYGRTHWCAELNRFYLRNT